MNRLAGILRQIDPLFICILLALTFSLFSCEILQPFQEVTVYPILPKQSVWNTTNQHFNERPITLNRITYKISVSRQEIIFWVPGVSDEPRRLVHCVVRDSEDWVGESQDGYREIKMVDGNYSEDPPKPLVVYVSKWRWWYIDILGRDIDVGVIAGIALLIYILILIIRHMQSPVSHDKNRQTS